jgi:hypothetical protein
MSKITKVQRIGVGLIGLVLVLSGASVATTNRSGGHWLVFPIGVAFIFIGFKILWNAVFASAKSGASN